MPNVKGSENICATVPADVAAEVVSLAGESGLSVSRYNRALLEHAVEHRRIFRLRFGRTEEVNRCSAPADYRINETPNPKRK